MTGRRAPAAVAAEVDVEELARSLEHTAAGLQRFIDAEAQKRVAVLAKEYAKAADERVRVAEAERLRQEDLVGELRRQLDVAVPKIERLAELQLRIGAEARAGSLLARDLWDIIYPPAAPAESNEV